MFAGVYNLPLIKTRLLRAGCQYNSIVRSIFVYKCITLRDGRQSSTGSQDGIFTLAADQVHDHADTDGDGDVAVGGNIIRIII